MMDSSGCYWKIELDRKKRGKTALTSHPDLFNPRECQLGSIMPLSISKKAIGVIPSSVGSTLALAYLNGIVLFSIAVREHMAHLWQVLTLLRDSALTLKLKNSSFLTEKIHYHGHAFRPGLFHISNITTVGIKKLTNPTSQTELRSFVGLWSVFRRIVPSVNSVPANLNKKLCMGEPTKFQTLSVIKKNPVEQLRFLPPKLPVLAFSRADSHLSIEADACDTWLGCVFSHKKQEGTMLSIEYWLRTLEEPEKNEQRHANSVLQSCGLSSFFVFT